MKNANGPQRTCISCRKAADKSRLIRYVLDPSGNVLVDYRQKLPGRGVYTCFVGDCIDSVIKRQGFKRGFKKNCQAPDAVALKNQVKTAIVQKIYNLIGMSRKAGEVTAGTNAVIDLLKKQQLPGLVLLATDISESIGEKIGQSADRKNIFHVRMFSKEEIGQLLGKDERSAIAIGKGALAEALKFELQRFEQL